ncbi:MAG: hypothetical protein R3175_08630 [Marinobacter sp.]|uniref:hypothetical protein n=1 Tax=Marinobacter sp. TaxID=50741 RepID=UPI00299F1B9B|nr:hypothetical protein [Marinobacter sp.]MDX1756108.1 hypothetical protein [Marinobacter sp.]
MSDHCKPDRPLTPGRNTSSNDDLLGDYIGAMFAEPPQSGVWLSCSAEWVDVKQALQCTWRDAPNPASAVVAALSLWRLYRQLPAGRLKTALRSRGMTLLGQSVEGGQ